MEGQPECLESEATLEDAEYLPDNEVNSSLSSACDAEAEQELVGSLHHPICELRPPNVLCYDQLGNPKYRVSKQKLHMLLLIQEYTIHLINHG